MSNARFERLSAPAKKMVLSTLMMVMVSSLWLLFPRPWKWWCLGAILVSWVADALLAGFPQVLLRLKNRFYFGAVLFASAHAFYAAASIMALRSMGQPFSWRPFCLVMAVFACTVLLHCLRFAPQSRHGKGFTAAACAYLLVVGAMSALAFRVAAQTGWRGWMLPLGACLFFLSDCILVVREYRRTKDQRMNRAIWVTYLSAQLLLQIGYCTLALNG